MASGFNPNPVHSSFARAEAAFMRGDLATARQLARELVAAAPATPQMLHLLAVVERRLGNVAEARQAFEAALGAAPADPQINSNYANLLAAIGDADSAVAHYHKAIAAAPGFADARLNLALLLKRLGRLDDAATELEAILAANSRHAKAWQALGATWRDLGDAEAAAAAFDKVLELAPADPLALLGRARAEADLGRPARAHFALGVERAPDQPDLALGHAVERFAEGDAAGALTELESLVSANPGWAAAQATLARMRHQVEGPADFTRGFAAALARNPADGPLWATWLRALSRASQHARVLDHIGEARAALGPSRTLDLIEAEAAGETGDIARADALFAKFEGDPDPNAAIPRIRHFLRTGRPDRAADLALPLMNTPLAGTAVPFLGTAWRLLGDARQEWIEGDDRLVMHQDLDIDVDALAGVLRALHLSHHHPFDQSLRGGTQTDGALFLRAEPEIRALRDAAQAAIDRYVAQLPPIDPEHPFLRQPRGRTRYSGSWSVRLTGSGFHVNHIHSEGWISSAFYVVLPESMAGANAAHQGWLALGQPPQELGLGLEPVRFVEPQPGRLALFPSTMWHGTLPFQEGERLTVAFDAVPRL